MHPLLVEGLTDAIGFVAGSLVGFALARLFGLDIFAEGYGSASIAGIALLGIMGGVGLQLARRWRAGRKKDNR
jgi:hypothetical protein